MSRRDDLRSESPSSHASPSLEPNGHADAAGAIDDLTKAQLLDRAERAGIANAARLTRLELLDELKRRTGLAPRGLLGRARDLLRGVVERGLVKALGVEPEVAAAVGAFVESASAAGASRARESWSASAPKPDAASDVMPISPEKSAAIATPPATPPATLPATMQASDDATSPPVATRTLAEIYFTQGHLPRARAVLREVLRVSPMDLEAKSLLARIDAKIDAKIDAASRPVADVEAPVAAPVAAAKPRDEFVDDPYATYSVDAIDPEAFVEPAAPAVDAAPPVPAMLDDEPLPARYDVDECVALSVDAFTVYVYWETRPATIARAQKALEKGGSEPIVAILRVLVVEPSLDGPRVSTRDLGVDALAIGETFVRSLPAGAVVRAAVGLRAGDRFLPLAHTADLESPTVEPSDVPARKVVVWTRDHRDDLTAIDATDPAPSVEAMRDALTKLRRERHGDAPIEAGSAGETRRVRLGSSEDAWAVSPGNDGAAGPNGAPRRGGASEMLPRR